MTTKRRHQVNLLLLVGLLMILGVGGVCPRRALAQGQPSPADPAGDAKPEAGSRRQMTEEQRRVAAKDAYKEAEGRFELGDYAGALPLYREAYILIPGDAPKYKIALMLDKLGRVKESVAAYEQFLQSNPPPDVFKQRIADATARLEILKKAPARVSVLTDPPVAQDLEVEVDGAPRTGRELTLPAGSHTITARGEGWKGATDVDLSIGESREVTIKLFRESEPAPAPTAAPASAAPASAAPANVAPASVAPASVAPAPRSNLPGYFTLGCAGAGIVAGTILGAVALHANTEYASAPSLQGLLTRDNWARLSDLAFGGAVVLGVVGVALILGNRQPVDRKAPPLKATIAPYFGPRDAGAAATIHF
jgi:hypothetical protein